MATMKEYIFSLDGADDIKAEVVAHLAVQGLDDPVDLGFLANAAGDITEGVVHRGCPSAWSTEHFRVLQRAVVGQAQGRTGSTSLTLLRLSPAAGSRSSGSLGPVKCTSSSGTHPVGCAGWEDTRWCTPAPPMAGAVVREDTRW